MSRKLSSPGCPIRDLHCMKLRNIIPQRYRNQVVCKFGKAKLIRQANGQHELVGGADTDRADAFEWSSLFAHEIVFTPTPPSSTRCGSAASGQVGLHQNR